MGFNKYSGESDKELRQSLVRRIDAMKEIKGTDIAYNGLTYSELGKLFYEAGMECPAGSWKKSTYKILYFEGLKAVFDAVIQASDANHNSFDPVEDVEDRVDAQIEEKDTERRYGK